MSKLKHLTKVLAINRSLDIDTIRYTKNLKWKEFKYEIISNGGKSGTINCLQIQKHIWKPQSLISFILEVTEITEVVKEG